MKTRKAQLRSCGNQQRRKRRFDQLLDQIAPRRFRLAAKKGRKGLYYVVEDADLLQKVAGLISGGLHRQNAEDRWKARILSATLCSIARVRELVWE